MELLYEAVIYFPVVCARGIFPVDIHAVKVIFFHERSKFLRKLIFAHLAEVYIAVFIPVNGGKDDNCAVHIIELRIVSDIFVALGEYLRRNISVEPLISRYFKSLCIALGLIVKLEQFYVCRHGVVAEFVYREPYAIRGHCVKAAHAHITPRRVGTNLSPSG